MPTTQPLVSPRGAPPRRPVPRSAGPGNGLGFALFILVNFALFVRPADLHPALVGVEIYRYLILACFAVSFPALLQYFASGQLERRPIDLCLLLTLPLVLLSDVVNAGFEHVYDTGIVYLKLLVYYFLFVSLVTTPARLRFFLTALLGFATLVVILSALDFYKFIKLPRMEFLNGKPVYIDPDRMYGPGIFSDPNDICVLIVTCLLVLLGKLSDPRAGFLRVLWFPPLAVFVFGFVLTQSRGGLLALLAGLGLMVRLRYGWPRAILIGAIGVPVLFVALAGRQTAISMSTTTGKERIYLWNDGLVMFRANPLFGVGMGRFTEHTSHVAHNSYMQAFSELGFVGGILFLGATLLAVSGLYRLARPAVVHGRQTPRVILDPELRMLYPFLSGAVAAYATGMITLSLNTLATTFTVFALANVFIAQATTQPPTEQARFDVALLVKLAGLGVLFLIAMFIVIRIGFQA